MNGLNIFFDTVDYRTPHAHPEWELILLLENALSVTCGQNDCLVEPGEVLLFSPDRLHEFHRVGESCTFLCLQISPRIMAQIYPAIDRMATEELFLRRHLPEGEYEQVRRGMLDLMGAYIRREPGYELYCMGKGCLLLHRILIHMPIRMLSPGEQSNRDKSNARLKRLIRFVDENYMHKIRLSDFAEREGCSVSYLSHFVKDTLNQSFQEYVNTVRFNCACKLIASGERRMLDVCVESGFSDYRYFSRTFRQQVGMTPEEYSLQVERPEQDSGAVKHSLHSLERFYTREQSLSLWERFADQ
jgi:AraC-like DNA-binding protein